MNPCNWMYCSLHVSFLVEMCAVIGNKVPGVATFEMLQ